MRYIELNPVRAHNMVSYPADYLWSSYQRNALGKVNSLITSHREYMRLGATEEARCLAYRQLFRARIPEMTLNSIREATNKAWVKGNDRFKTKVARQIDRPVQTSGQGGDRKSELYQSKVNQRV